MHFEKGINLGRPHYMHRGTGGRIVDNAPAEMPIFIQFTERHDGQKPLVYLTAHRFGGLQAEGNTYGLLFLTGPGHHGNHLYPSLADHDIRTDPADMHPLPINLDYRKGLCIIQRQHHLHLSLLDLDDFADEGLA